MSNVHIHLHVSNLEASRAFYERFLGASRSRSSRGTATLPLDSPRGDPTLWDGASALLYRGSVERAGRRMA